MLFEQETNGNSSDQAGQENVRLSVMAKGPSTLFFL